MKLTIKTKSYEIEYEDDYSCLERDVKLRLEDLIKLIRETETDAKLGNKTVPTSEVIR